MAHILQKDVAPNLQTWDEAGLTCKIHVIGSGEMRQTLNNLEALRKGNQYGSQHKISAGPSESQRYLPWLKARTDRGFSEHT